MPKILLSLTPELHAALEAETTRRLNKNVQETARQIIAEHFTRQQLKK